MSEKHPAWDTLYIISDTTDEGYAVDLVAVRSVRSVVEVNLDYHPFSINDGAEACKRGVFSSLLKCWGVGFSILTISTVLASHTVPKYTKMLLVEMSCCFSAVQGSSALRFIPHVIGCAWVEGFYRLDDTGCLLPNIPASFGNFSLVVQLGCTAVHIYTDSRAFYALQKPKVVISHGKLLMTHFVLFLVSFPQNIFRPWNGVRPLCMHINAVPSTPGLIVVMFMFAVAPCTSWALSWASLGYQRKTEREYAERQRFLSIDDRLAMKRRFELGQIGVRVCGVLTAAYAMAGLALYGPWQYLIPCSFECHTVNIAVSQTVTVACSMQYCCWVILGHCGEARPACITSLFRAVSSLREKLWKKSHKVSPYAAGAGFDANAEGAARIQRLMEVWSTANGQKCQKAERLLGTRKADRVLGERLKR